MFDGLFVFAVLFKHYKAYSLCFLLKLYQYECGGGKLQYLRHVAN